MTGERLAQAVIFRAQVMHSLITFWTPNAAVWLRQELGRQPDIAAAEMVKEALARQICAVTGRTDLAHVEMVAVASRAQTHAVEEAGFEVIELGESDEIAVDIRASGVKAITVFCRRFPGR